MARRRAKPATAPLAPVALAVAAGIVADRYADLCGTAAWGAIALGAVVLAACTRRASAQAAFLFVALLALGGGWHHRCWSDLAADDLARSVDEEPRPAWLRGVLVDVAEFRPGEGAEDEGRTRTVLAVSGASDGRRWHAASGRVQILIRGDRSDLAMGEPVTVAGTLEAQGGPLNPGEFDYCEFLRARGIRLRMALKGPDAARADPEGTPWPAHRLLGRLRVWSRERLERGLDARAVPLAAALLLGRREQVEPEVNDAFARTGTTHLLAISGLHLQVLAGVFGWICMALGLGRKRTFITVALASVAYALLVGLMPSVVRSTTMTVTVCLAGLFDRCARPANALALAALATMAFNPADLFDVGCQLSFLAVATLIWGVGPTLAWWKGHGLGYTFDVVPPRLDVRAAGDPLDALERSLEPRWKRAVRWCGAWAFDGVVLSAIIWLVGLPLVALRFHVASPVGILINLPLIPMTSLALMLAGISLGLSSLWLPLGRPAAWLCGVLLDGTERIVRWGATRSWGHAFVAGPSWWWTAGFYLLLGLATWATIAGRPRRRIAWLLVACWLVVPPALLLTAGDVTPEAEVLAVDHGLAVVLRAAPGRAVLYDCGRMRDPHVGRRIIAPALWARGIHRLDAVILSHADSDHYNGLPDLLDRLPIGVVRVPPGFDGAGNPGAVRLLERVRARGVAVRSLAAGEQLDIGPGMAAEALHPDPRGSIGATDNERSIVLDVVSRGRSLLLTGDLDGEGLAAVVARPDGEHAAVVAPHHGGRTANPEWFYDWARPGLVIASQRAVQPGVRDALAVLEPRGVPVLRTWQVGAVRLRWEAGGLAASGFLDARPDGSLVSPARSSAMHWITTLDTGPLLATLGQGPPRWLAGLLGLAAGFLACAAMAVVEWGAWSLVRPGRRFQPGAPEPPPWEPIAIEAADGARLAGAWRGSAHRVAILLHGFAEDRSALLDRAEMLAARGWSVALLDARGRGRSGGPWTTFGALEADDLRLWMDRLEERAGPGACFVLWGRSMGAAIALRAAAADLRPAALVLEAPYADLTTAIGAYLALVRIPRLLAGPMIRRAGRLAGVPLGVPGPVAVAPDVDRPVLILHGADDRIAPAAEVQRLEAAFGRPVERLEVPGARHGDVYTRGGVDLADRIAAFLDAACPAPS